MFAFKALLIRHSLHRDTFPAGEGDCHICGGRATTASGGFFDEPIGSACGMPQGGKCKPPARLVVMTYTVIEPGDIEWRFLNSKHN